jgi:hypothetical protein
MGGHHKVEVKGKAFLERPDLREPLHCIAGLAENDPLQEIELPPKQTFKRGFNQMATIGGEVCLDIGHLDRRAHEPERKSPSRMKKFFRNIGAEKTDHVIF